MSNQKKNDTKFEAPLENDRWVFEDTFYKKQNPEKEHRKQLENYEISIGRNHFMKKKSFLTSRFGEIAFFTKLENENSLKTHCLNSCLNMNLNGPKNTTQVEKLCLANCAKESFAMYNGFKLFYDRKINAIINDENFTIDSTLNIKQI